MTLTLEEIARITGGRLAGDGAREIDRVAPLESAGPDSITFVTETKQVPKFLASEAGAAIVPEKAVVEGRDVIHHENPYAGLARLLEHLHPEPPPEPGVSEFAQVHASATIGEGVSVGPYCMIGPGTTLEDGVVIHAHCVLLGGSTIGAGTVLYPRVVLYRRVRIGSSCKIHSGAVIGAPGFGYTREGEGHTFIPQVGGVELGDHVDVGPNSCIDAGTLAPTRIESHVKIDNLVQVGHNSVVGARVLLCGQVGMAGSTIIEPDCVLAGQVGVGGHLTLGRGTMAGAQAAVLQSTAPGSRVGGVPAFDFKQWRKAARAFQDLPEMKKELRALRKRLAELESGR